MFPQQAGKLTIDAARFDASIAKATQVADPFEAFFNGGSNYVEVKKTILTPQLTIDVKPLPAGKPADFSSESQTKGVSGGPSAPYGRYGNIFLSQTEYDELQAEYPDRLERFIEEMSRYLAASGKSYQNYAAALRIWAGNDKKGAPKKGIPDYSCKEGESL